ncbi:hypothetical protein WN48_07089 [Eufriesea mexicana]|uniref:Uncharacterized protein n=1 Tax=Eufriesea mexicana TaxID=516756 RepID=A0A310SVK1_9HYME|nr:hypothetical protein WN48_07089 [Eufriesea mexicana]
MGLWRWFDGMWFGQVRCWIRTYISSYQLNWHGPTNGEEVNPCLNLCWLRDDIIERFSHPIKENVPLQDNYSIVIEIYGTIYGTRGAVISSTVKVNQLKNFRLVIRTRRVVTFCSDCSTIISRTHPDLETPDQPSVKDIFTFDIATDLRTGTGKGELWGRLASWRIVQSVRNDLGLAGRGMVENQVEPGWTARNPWKFRLPRSLKMSAFRGFSREKDRNRQPSVAASELCARATSMVHGQIRFDSALFAACRRQGYKAAFQNI